MKRITLITILVVLSLGVVLAGSSVAQVDDPENIVITDGDWRFEIERFGKLGAAGELLPDNDIFIVLFAILHNDSDQVQCLKASAIRLYLDDEEYKPQNSAMDEVAKLIKPERDFMGAYAGQCVESDSSEPTFVVFDIPDEFEDIVVSFRDESVSLETLDFAESKPLVTRYVTGQRVNVRSCIGTGCDVVTQLNYGDSFGVTGQGEDSGGAIWYSFEYESETVWIAGWLTSTQKPAAAQPQSQPAAPQGQTAPQPTSPPAPAQPTQIPQSTLPPAPTIPPTPAWNCNGDLYNCNSFNSCSDMWDYWNTCPGDPSNLDGDNDGYPCESSC